jgi:hypothetical protein
MSFIPDSLSFRFENYQNQQPSKLSKHKLEDSYGPVRKRASHLDDASSCLFKDWKVVYHGTSKKNAKVIAQEGLSLANKTKGATEFLKDKTGLFDQHHNRYHYVSLSAKEAASYAKMHKKPAIKVLLVDSSLLEEDLASPTEKTAKRIKENIPKENILPEEIIRTNDENQWKRFFDDLGISFFQAERIKHKIASQKRLSELIDRAPSALSLVEEQQSKLKDYVERTSPDVYKMMPGQSLELSLSPDDLDKISGVCNFLQDKKVIKFLKQD